MISAYFKIGHVWIGCDVSRDMIDVANERIERKRLDAKRSANGKDDCDMEEDGENDSSSDDDSEGGNRMASTGDLMHHVSVNIFDRYR